MLEATKTAISLVHDLRPLVEQIRKRDNTLAKQLVDAMNSTVQNLCEGEAHRGGNKRLKYEIAYGEANEVRGSLELALAWGYIREPPEARAKLWHLLRLCYGLVNSDLINEKDRKTKQAKKPDSA